MDTTKSRISHIEHISNRFITVLIRWMHYYWPTRTSFILAAFVYWIFSTKISCLPLRNQHNCIMYAILTQALDAISWHQFSNVAQTRLTPFAVVVWWNITYAISQEAPSLNRWGRVMPSMSVTLPLMVQIMACRLAGDKSLSKPMLGRC